MSGRRSSHEEQIPLFPESDLAAEQPEGIDPRPEMICFRGQTLALVRHFFELSCQVGRIPSLLGREFFRAKVSHHAIPSFEEQAVFVRDMELCLARLSDEHTEMITLVGLYDLTRDDIAEMLRHSRAWVTFRISEAVDSLSEIFLKAGLLDENRPDRRQRQVTGGAGKRPCTSVALERRAEGSATGTNADQRS
jgi:hypothetical protein